MKRIFFLAVIIVLATLNSCKDGKGIFGKSKESEARITNLERENQALRNELSNIEEEHSAEITAIRTDYEQKLADLQKQIEAGNIAEYKAYYVVVGSFKNLNYAKDYAEKIKVMGYEGKIVPGPNNFNLVTSGTFTTLKTSVTSMKEAREKIASEAWIYFKQ